MTENSKNSFDKNASENIDDIEKELKLLAREYLEELPERFLFIRTAIEKHKLKNDTKVNLQEVKSESHQIKGTAASYGFNEIGAEAIIIDDCLKLICTYTNKTEINNELWLKLEKSLENALRLTNLALSKNLLDN